MVAWDWQETESNQNPDISFMVWLWRFNFLLLGLPAKSATTKAGDQVFNTWVFGEHWRSDQKTTVFYSVTSSYQIPPKIVIMWHFFFFVTGLLHLTWWGLFLLCYSKWQDCILFRIIPLYTCASFPPPIHQLVDTQVTALSWLLWQRCTGHGHADDFPALCFLSLNSWVALLAQMVALSSVC